MSVQKCLNLPLTHNSQPATQNLPFYCPLKVGSGLFYHLKSTLIEPLSPSPQGRVGTGWLVKEEEDWQALSPSPQGRVGTEMLRVMLLPSIQVAVPSRSGRNTYTMIPSALNFGVAVPSRSGRNLYSSGDENWAILSRRPLKVGSERHCAHVGFAGNVGSPSPQGRVGTFFVARRNKRAKKSPSPQGRVGTKAKFGFLVAIWVKRRRWLQ